MSTLILISRTFSKLFRPNYYPTVCFAVVLGLMLSTSAAEMNWEGRLFVLFYGLSFVLLVLFCTLLVPLACIRAYLRLTHLHPMDLRRQHQRPVPYLIHILLYLVCLQLLLFFGMPSNVCCIIVASLMLQVGCTVFNVWHKVSMHSAAAAGLTGTLLAYSSIYHFNPIGWLCAAILLWGFVATSRMILRTHSLSEVLLGGGVGLITTYISIVHASMWIN